VGVKPHSKGPSLGEMWMIVVTCTVLWFDVNIYSIMVSLVAHSTMADVRIITSWRLFKGTTLYQIPAACCTLSYLGV